MGLSQGKRMEKEDERIRETIFREKLLGVLRSPGKLTQALREPE